MVFLQFRFWEPVYYAKYNGKFTADSTEELGRFMGIGKHVGHAMTFKILMKDDKVIHRSVVRSATGTGAFINQKATVAAKQPRHNSTTEKSPEDTFQSELQEDITRARRENASARGESIPIIDTANLLGRTFIDDPDIVGAQRRATIEEVIPTNTRTSDNKEQLFRFRAKVGEKTFEHLMTYNKMVKWCERDQQAEGIYRIEAITGHWKTKKGTYKVQVS
jgi:hypothetical protein